MKKKICITYIATNGYHVYFSVFYESLKKFFCTTEDISIAVVTDIPEYFQNYTSDVIIYTKEKQTDKNYTKFHKFHDILLTQKSIEQSDYWFYINANVVFFEPISFQWLTHGKPVTISRAFWGTKNTIAKSVKSTAYFQPSEHQGYFYVNTGFIGATPTNIIKIANDVRALVDADFASGAYKNVCWHDETYFNKYIWTDLMKECPQDINVLPPEAWCARIATRHPHPRFWYFPKKEYPNGTDYASLVRARDIILEEQKPLDSAIVYESDGRNVDILKWSVYSARRACGNLVKIFVLTNLNKTAFPQSTELAERYKVEFIKIDDKMLLDLGVDVSQWRSRWPHTVLYRLLIPFLSEFRSFRSVVHLDTDILMFSKEAANLLRLKSCEHEMHAPPDITSTVPKVLRLRDDKSLISGEMRAKLEARTWNSGAIWCRSYLNAGVVVFHLNVIRKDLSWYKERLVYGLDLVMKRRLPYNDQDVINIFYDVGMLSSMYDKIGNKCPVFWEHAVIHHYAGGRKRDMLGDAQKYLEYPLEPSDSTVTLATRARPTIPNLPSFTVYT